MKSMHSGRKFVNRKSNMLKLSDTVVKEEYLQNDDKVVLLGDKEVTVVLNRSDTRSGSWERGFKFGSVTYGLLRRRVTTKAPYARHEYSADHGKTWHPDEKAAKKVKGKTIVARSSSKEFAFDSIQKINRDYDPNYKWRP